MLADFARELARVGTIMVIDGADVLAFTRPAADPDFTGGPFSARQFIADGMRVEAKYLFVNPADLIYPPKEGGAMVVGGVEYRVGSVDSAGVACRILLVRYIS